MSEERFLPSAGGGRKILLSVVLAVLMLAVLYQSIAAYTDEQPLAAPDLSNSSKSVNYSQAKTSDTLKYSIALRNDGGQTAAEVTLEDLLPAEVDYVASSLEVVPAIGLYGESGGVITWTGALNVSQEIVINFQAKVAGDVVPEVTITNTAVISAAGVAIERSAATTILSDTNTYMFLPVLTVPPPGMSMALLASPNSDNQWTIGFTPADAQGLTGYEIQEAQDPTFYGAGLIKVNSPGISSLERTKTPSPLNKYYYRARAVAGNLVGNWSSVLTVVSNYRDDFDSMASGWHMVRQDTDDVSQETYYSSGNFVHRQHGRWDYLISSPLAEAPGDSYRIDAYARFVGVDNLHALGLIFGADWDGSQCPNADYSSCFNHYYRLLVLWHGAPDSLMVELKRIDNHDPANNAGRGVALVNYMDVKVNTPPDTWQKWTIERLANGQINLFVNDTYFASVTDSTYTGKYFGGFSATNEYAGLDVRFDWYSVTVMD
jgi:uncharacterized repeat protein (TIGR01451 family)